MISCPKCNTPKPNAIGGPTSVGKDVRRVWTCVGCLHRFFTYEQVCDRSPNTKRRDKAPPIGVTARQTVRAYFHRDLQELVEQHHMDYETGTAPSVIASYLANCMDNWNASHRKP